MQGVTSQARASRAQPKSTAAIPTRPPLSEESGFNFLVRAKRRRKGTEEEKKGVS